MIADPSLLVTTASSRTGIVGVRIRSSTIKLCGNIVIWLRGRGNDPALSGLEPEVLPIKLPRNIFKTIFKCYLNIVNHDRNLCRHSFFIKNRTHVQLLYLSYWRSRKDSDRHFGGRPLASKMLAQ